MDEAVTIGGEEYLTGCYVSGHVGIYSTEAILAIADDALGSDFFDLYDKAGRMDYEHYLDIEDAAVRALNDATPDGYWWGRFDGEFFLQSNEWWEEE